MTLRHEIISENFLRDYREPCFFTNATLYGTYGIPVSELEKQLFNRYNDISWGYDYAGQFTSLDHIWHSPVMDGLGNANLNQETMYEDWNDDGVIDENDSHPIAFGAQILCSIFRFLDLLGRHDLLHSKVEHSTMSNTSGSLNRSFTQNGPDFFYDRWHMEDPSGNPLDPRTIWIPGYLPTTSRQVQQW